MHRTHLVSILLGFFAGYFIFGFDSLFIRAIGTILLIVGAFYSGKWDYHINYNKDVKDG